MARFITIFVLIILCGVSAGLYPVKYSVDHMERQGVALRLKIAQEQESIRILEAEWSNLNRPSRLQKLSERYLDLAPVQVSQIVNFAAIPERGHAEEVAEADAKARGLAKASSMQDIKTRTAQQHGKTIVLSPAATSAEAR